MNTTMLRIIDWCNSVLESGRPEQPLTGICANLQDYMSDDGAANYTYIGSMLFDLYETFPEFSGDFLYPLDSKGVLYKNPKIRKWSGDYGDKRLRLVKHIRDELDKRSGLL